MLFNCLQHFSKQTILLLPLSNVHGRHLICATCIFFHVPMCLTDNIGIRSRKQQKKYCYHQNLNYIIFELNFDTHGKQIDIKFGVIVGITMCMIHVLHYRLLVYVMDGHWAQLWADKVGLVGQITFRKYKLLVTFTRWISKTFSGVIRVLV